ncbi:MAG: segregation and condensation protein [Planctomycetota bacterium]|nr:MAG: segregation and condensation protein [Planctomycetota bacterium]
MAKKKLTPSEPAAPPAAEPAPPPPTESPMSVEALAAPAEPEGADPPMDESSAIRTFEALVFATNDPLAPTAVRKILPGATPARIRRWAESLQREYDERGRAFQLREIAGGWQILTRPEHAEAVGKMLKVRSEGKLSTAALETLAIVAYRQPINRADLESIRGVGSGPLLRALMEKGLVKVTGKEETLGRPVLYGTTDRFLELLGLASVKDLPKPEELKG